MSNSDPVLAQLAAEINEHETSRRACEIKGLMHGLRVGQLLLDAKAVVPHGAFREWVEANTTVSTRMCQYYMKVARSPRIQHLVEHEDETVSLLTLTAAVELARQPKSREDRARKRFVREICARWEKAAEIRREYVRCLGEAKEAFAAEGASRAEFVSWLAENAAVGPAFAAKIPAMLEEDYDDGVWTEAMLLDIFPGVEAYLDERAGVTR